MTDFVPEWIWGSSNETEVYAQGYGAGLTVIFRFEQTDTASPPSLANRIVKFYHASGPRASAVASSTPAGFVDRNEMRATLWAAAHEVWLEVIEDHDIGAVNAVVNLEGAVDEGVEWTVVHHAGLDTFVKRLQESEGIGQPWLKGVEEFVPFEDLIRYNHVGGRGCSTKVRQKDDMAEICVFKGLDFRTFLNYSDGARDSTIRAMVKVWHHANNIVAQMPRHPRILAPTTTAVTLTLKDGAKVICGCLWPYQSNGDVASRLKKAHEDRVRLPLELKKRWCLQMVEAVYHTHRVAHTYHMDIKPGNFLIDDEENLILIDWEQSDAPALTLAPEADGTFDVEELSPANGAQPGELVYMKYQGPERCNMDGNLSAIRSWNKWNVFPEWNKTHPTALELAEVFSLGRSMWMLLEQPEVKLQAIKHPNDLKVEWQNTADIPESWISAVVQCISEDPNQRPSLDRLLDLVSHWKVIAEQ